MLVVTWMVILYVTLTGLRNTQIAGKMLFLGEFVKVLREEIYV